MKITNYLDILPVELHLYINDIINSDRRFHDWEKAVKHLEDNFIHDLFFRQNWLKPISMRKYYWFEVKIHNINKEKDNYWLNDYEKICPCKRCQQHEYQREMFKRSM